MSNGKKQYFYKKAKKDEQGVKTSVLRLGNKARVRDKVIGDEGDKRKRVVAQKKYYKPGESGWKETKTKFKIASTKKKSGYYKKTKDTKSVSKTKTQSGPKKGVTEKIKYFKNPKRKTSAKKVMSYKEGSLKRKVTKTKKVRDKKGWGVGLDYGRKASPRRKYIKRNYKEIN